MTAILNYRMTATLRYRTMLVLAVFSFCCGIGASLTWVYVLYSREVSNSIVTAILILMMALTGASFLLARFVKNRLRTIASAN